MTVRHIIHDWLNRTLFEAWSFHSMCSYDIDKPVIKIEEALCEIADTYKISYVRSPNNNRLLSFVRPDD